MDESVLGLLRKKQQANVLSCTEFLADGCCKSYEEYRLVVGKIQGLNSAILDINDLEKQYVDE